MKDLFDEINEDYYEPVITRSAFNGNYTQYESRGDKYKSLSPEEYPKMSRPYLRDMINKHKAPSEDFLDSDLYGECKIQLIMQINFISFLDTREIRTMQSKSENIKILMGSKTGDTVEFFTSNLGFCLELGLLNSETKIGTGIA